MADVRAVIRLCSSILEDHGQERFPDGLLIPLIDAAQRKLQRKLAEAGAQNYIDTVEISVLTGQTRIYPGAIAPDSALPADFLVPHFLWEKGTGTSERYKPLRRYTRGLPDFDSTNSLACWIWQAGEIRFLASLRDNTVKLRYEKELPALTLATDPLRLPGSLDALAQRAAELAARPIDKSLAQEFGNEFQEETSGLISSHVKPTQHFSVRPKPLRLGRRSGRYY